MNFEKFTQIVSDPKHTKDDLKKLLANAKKKPGEPEYARLVMDELNKRFPNWDRPKQGGKTRNIAVFKGEECTFESAKEGYIWLVEKFISVRPDFFSNPSQDTMYLAVGKGANYFAGKPQKLFPQSPHLADDQNNYFRLKNGRYANVNLSNVTKFDVLLRFSAITKVNYLDEWDWIVDSATETLRDKQEIQLRAKQAMGELDEFFKEFFKTP